MGTATSTTHTLNTIVAQGNYGHHEEALAGTAIRPGMLIEVAADGEVDPLVSTAAEAAKGGCKIAKEDAQQGKTVIDAYAIGDVVQFYSPLPGDVLQVLVKAGETIAVGDKLIPEIVSGLWVEAAGTEARYWFEALEARSPVTTDGLVRARFLK